MCKNNERDTQKSGQHLLTLMWFQTCIYIFFFLLNTKEDITLIKQLDYHCIFPTKPFNCLLTSFTPSSFVFNRSKKLIQVLNNMRVRVSDDNFGVNYPFKCLTRKAKGETVS